MIFLLGFQTRLNGLSGRLYTRAWQSYGIVSEACQTPPTNNGPPLGCDGPSLMETEGDQKMKSSGPLLVMSVRSDLKSSKTDWNCDLKLSRVMSLPPPQAKLTSSPVDA